MFNDETTLFKKGQDNVITTKERRETGMWSFFEDRGNIKCRENRRKSRFLTCQNYE